MASNKNPGLTPCQCHPKGGGVVLLDFDEDFLKTALDEHDGSDIDVIFRGEKHTFSAHTVQSEVTRRFSQRFRYGQGISPHLADEELSPTQVEVRHRGRYYRDADGNEHTYPNGFDWAEVPLNTTDRCEHVETICSDCLDSWACDYELRFRRVGASKEMGAQHRRL